MSLVRTIIPCSLVLLAAASATEPLLEDETSFIQTKSAINVRKAENHVPATEPIAQLELSATGVAVVQQATNAVPEDETSFVQTKSFVKVRRRQQPVEADGVSTPATETSRVVGADPVSALRTDSVAKVQRGTSGDDALSQWAKRLHLALMQSPAEALTKDHISAKADLHPRTSWNSFIQMSATSGATGHDTRCTADPQSCSVLGHLVFQPWRLDLIARRLFSRVGKPA